MKRLTEKSLSKGQRNDNKLVDGLPPFLELSTFSRENFVGNLLVSASESAEFAWNLLLRKTQFPLVKNLWENGEYTTVEDEIEVVGNGKCLVCGKKEWDGFEEQKIAGEYVRHITDIL